MHKAPLKLTIFTLLTTLLLVAASGAVFAAGTAADPLITKSYLEGTLFQEIVSAIHEKTGSKDTAPDIGSLSKIKAIGDSALSKLTVSELADYAAGVLISNAATQIALPGVNELRAITLAAGEGIEAKPGSVIIVTSGRIQTDNGSGTLINLKTSTETARNWELSRGSWYIVTEKSGVRLSSQITGATLMVSGEFSFNGSVAYEPQYDDLADALRSMGLFMGTDTGYELERVCKREEGLVMLIRLFGCETPALAYKGDNPFIDLAGWFKPYAGYALTNSITNGMSATRFGSGILITPAEYMTFVLRSLGYSDSGDSPDFNYKSSLDAAVKFGVITQKESEMLASAPLYRDKVVYISYYALFAEMKGSSQRLLDSLIKNGSVDKNEAYRAILAVDRKRS